MADTICSTCGLPKELCVCETIAMESQRIEIYLEKKKFNKFATVIAGIDTKEIKLIDVAKTLKNELATGGTAKEGKIELLGNHIKSEIDKHKVRKILEGLGFAPNTIHFKEMGRK